MNVGSVLGGPERRAPATHMGSLLKIYVLIGLTTVLAVGAGYFLSRYSWFYGPLFLLGFLIFFIIQALVVKRSPDIVCAGVLNSAALSVFLYKGSASYALISFAILTILFMWAHFRGKYEIENMVRLKFTRAARPVIGLLLTGVFTWAGIILFASGSLFLEEANVNRIVELIGRPLAEKISLDFSSSMKLGDFLGEVAVRQLSQESEFNQLNSPQRKAVVQDFTQGLISSIESTAQTELDINKSVGQNVHQFLVSKSQLFSEQSKLIRLLLLVMALLLTAKGVEFILYIPLVVLAFVMYELMVALGFVVLQYENRSKEVISLS